MKRVLVTGATGFVGRNLLVHLQRRADIEVHTISHERIPADLAGAAKNADFVFHLAGVNRPIDPAEFHSGNVEATEALCTALASTGRKVPIVYTSSRQAEQANPYGTSKRVAEEVLKRYRESTGAEIFLFRLPNVFGKWCRPNYNSVVATFCHNIGRDLPIQVNDPTAMVSLVYIDDVVEEFVNALEAKIHGDPYCEVSPIYRISLGDLAETIRSFKASRSTLIADRVGEGLTRALYSTFVSALPAELFSYEVPKHTDQRGTFVEMLKTQDSGQFSYFTAHPGVTRGGHFHHTKVEKFLVLQGKARFGFRHIITGERFDLVTSGETPRVVETVPGWAHDVTNVGVEVLVVMLWANEIFDRARPDTFVHPV